MTSVVVLVIDFRTKKEILAAANKAHDDLEKLEAINGITDAGGNHYPTGPTTVHVPSWGSVDIHESPPMEKGNAGENSNGSDSGCEGSGIELPKRTRRIASPGIQASGKRVGSRTVAKVPREDK